MRLNRYLASCGLGSRRSVESLITSGSVRINGAVCRNLGTVVDEDTDEVQVEDRSVSQKRATTVMLHKPAGYITSRRDESGRRTVYDLLPPEWDHLRYVGRLDLGSEGLLVLSSDGALVQELSHPSRCVEKEYEVLIDRSLHRKDQIRMLEGIKLREGLARAEKVECITPKHLSLVLTQGWKRQIRRMVSHLGYEVKALRRVRVGGLVLGELRSGKWQVMTPAQMAALLRKQ